MNSFLLFSTRLQRSTAQLSVLFGQCNSHSLSLARSLYLSLSLSLCVCVCVCGGIFSWGSLFLSIVFTVESN